MLSEKYLGKPLKDIQLSGLIGDLIGGAKKFGLEIPPDFLLVGKALMTIEGVAKEIYPDLDVLSESKPFFLELLKKRYSPQRIGNELWRGIERIGSSTYDLPQLSREVLEDLRLGRLAVSTNDTKLPGALDRLGRRLFTAALASAFTVAAVLARGAGEPRLGIGLFAMAALVLGLHVVASFFSKSA